MQEESPTAPDVPIHSDDTPSETATQGKKRRKKVIPFPGKFPFSEIEVAHRIVEKHGTNIRWCVDEQLWYVWCGTHWKPELDSHGAVYRCVKATIQGLLSEAAEIESDSIREAAAKFAAGIQKHASISAVMQIIKSDTNINMSDFDTDAWLLNLANGTLNLRTGTLQKPERSDFITRQSPVKYDPTATAPQWEDFVAWTCKGSPGFVAFKKRLYGSFLTGVVRDQKVCISYGEGANGKSTEYGTLQKLLGPQYSVSISADSIMSTARRNGAAASPDIIALKGARLAVVGEGEEGQHFQEGLVKLLSGGDVIVARPLYGRQVNFDASHKLVMFTNHRPVIRDTGHGIWRRLQVLPAEANIDIDAASGKRVKRSNDEMNALLAAEMPGILNWLIAGCMEWQKSGLGDCDEVRAATSTYRQDMDLIGAFLTEWLIPQTYLDGIKVKDSYAAYREWTVEEGRDKFALTRQRFVEQLKKRGATTKQMHARDTVWFGLDKIKADLEAVALTAEMTPSPETVAQAPTPDSSEWVICKYKACRGLVPLSAIQTFTISGGTARMATCPHCHHVYNADYQGWIE